jgi:membrane-associated protease RseP (regulator of RpoE activity)
MVLATLAMLEFFSIVVNLMPVPPLDGFQAAAAYMNEDTRTRLLQPQVQNFGMVVLFMLLWKSPLGSLIFVWGLNLMGNLGFGDDSRLFFHQSMITTLGR